MADLTPNDSTAQPVLDRRTLDAFIRDVGAAAFPALLTSFRREIAARRDTLHALMTRDDLEAVEVSAHSLKATARTIGAMELSACAAWIERAALDGDTDTVRTAGAPLDQAVAACLAALESLS